MKLFLLLLSLSLLTGCATPAPSPFIERNGKAIVNPEYISFEIQKRYLDFRLCFLKDYSTIDNKVRVNMDFEITDKGDVSKSKVTSNDITSLTTLNCMKTILNEIHYPATGNGELVRIIQPINFINY